MTSNEKFIRFVRNSLKFRLFLFKKLPSAFFSGIKVREISENHAVVSVPFRFATQNPFRSIYFASQAMAAELSTGILAMMHISGQKPPVSMLVFDMKAEFKKKAVTTIYFTCNDGKIIQKAVEHCIETGEGVTVQAHSTGRDYEGNIVSEFYFTWTFKQKK